MELKITILDIKKILLIPIKEGNYIICILANNKLEAKRWADGQLLEDDEWFYPTNELDLLTRKDFHVIIVGSIGTDTTYNSFFEHALSLAKQRGRMK